MAWIPMYLLREDVAFISDWLNQENEIAFLVHNGPKKWIANKKHDMLEDMGTQKFGQNHDFVIPNFVEFNLWHVPSGPLPLLESNTGGVKLESVDNHNKLS